MRFDLASLDEPLSSLSDYRVLRSYKGETASRHESVICIADADDALGVLCTVHLPVDWLTKPPKVWCHEGWFRRGNIDWHAYSDGSLCWDLHLRWYFHLESLMKVMTREQLALHAAEYLLNSVRSLLLRHFTGYKLGLKSWPSEWLQWSHGNAGVAEYMTTRNK